MFAMRTSSCGDNLEARGIPRHAKHRHGEVNRARMPIAKKAVDISRSYFPSLAESSQYLKTTKLNDSPFGTITW
jgi:hypothetical protein